MRHAPDRLIDPFADAQQVVDDGAEKECTEEPETKGYRDVAIENTPELILFDERVAHVIPFRSLRVRLARLPKGNKPRR